MTSKHTKKGHLIKFFFGRGPENLISCSAFWPSVCELSSDVLVCQEFPHIEDTEACLKCVNLLPSLLFAFIIISRVILILIVFGKNVLTNSSSSFQKVPTKCHFTQTCENTRFAVKYKIQPTWIKDKSLIAIMFDNPEVVYHNTYISYDLQSLIGEVGGLLGLTMGASALTLSESLLKRVQYYLS